MSEKFSLIFCIKKSWKRENFNSLWYNLTMNKNNHIINNDTPKQLKLPIEIEKIIDFSDPVYFNI